MKLRTKIIASSALGAVACLLLGLLSIASQSFSVNSLAELNHEAHANLEAVDAARSAQVAFKIQVQEWKNILLRGSDPTAFAKYKDGFGQGRKSFHRSPDHVENVGNGRSGAH